MMRTFEDLARYRQVEQQKNKNVPGRYDFSYKGKWNPVRSYQIRKELDREFQQKSHAETGVEKLSEGHHGE